MIKKWNEFIREFVEEPINVEYISARMEELVDICEDLNMFEWHIDNKSEDSEGQLNITFIVGEIHYEEFVTFTLNLDDLNLTKVIGEDEVEYSEKVVSVEEGLDIIEKEIYKYLGVSESFEDNELTGKRIELVRLEDPYTNLKQGDKGTVKGVDDMGHILMQWDNGSTLNIVPDFDEFNVIDENLIQGGFDSLKQRLTDHFHEQESDFDPEETENVLEILNDYDDHLTGLGGVDKTLLLRLINDDELYSEVDSIEPRNIFSDENLFD